MNRAEQSAWDGLYYMLEAALAVAKERAKIVPSSQFAVTEKAIQYALSTIPEEDN